MTISRSYDGPTKNGRPRTLPLHPELVTLLRRHRAWWRVAFARRPAAADLVFPTVLGTMRSARCGAEFPRLLARCKLPRMAYHGLRHTGATLYRAAGVRREDVSEMLGNHEAPLTDLYAPADVAVLHGEIQRLHLLAALKSSSNGSSGGGPSGDLCQREETERLDGGRGEQLGSSTMPPTTTVEAGRLADDRHFAARPAPPADYPAAGATARDVDDSQTGPISGGAPRHAYARDELAALLGDADPARWIDRTPRGAAISAGYDDDEIAALLGEDRS